MKGKSTTIALALLAVLALAGNASAGKPPGATSFSNFEVAATPPNPPGIVCPLDPLCYNAAAEPAIRATPDGQFFGSSENGLGGGTLAWRSSNNGLNYTSLVSPNDVSAGSTSVGKESGLEPGGGDTDLAVATAKNSAGFFNVYVASLTLASVDVSTSRDNGQSFTLNPVTALPIDDREWTAATGANKVCISYLTAPGILLPNVGLHVGCSYDGGASFLQVANAYDTSQTGIDASQGGSRTGNLAFDPSNPNYLYTVFAYETVADGANPNAFLHNVGIAVSSDGGATFHDYPVHLNPDVTAKYDNQFVNVAVDKGGNVYVVYSDQHSVSYSYSTDHGQTFTGPIAVSKPGDTAIFPWTTAGDAGKVDIVYYKAAGYVGSPETAPSTVGWNVAFAQNLAATTPGSAFSEVAASPTNHYGAVCQGGVGCTGNRDLYDDFGVAASPTTGRASVIYSDDRYTTDANDPAQPGCTAAYDNRSRCDHTSIATQTSGQGIFTIPKK